FSSLSSFSTRCVTHPLDTIKIRIQNTQGHQAPAWSWRRHAGGGGGLMTSHLYQGLPIALCFSVPALGVYLTTYDTVKPRIERWLLNIAGNDAKANGVETAVPPWIALATYGFAGACAEIGSGLLWTPMEVVKNRQQAASPLSHASQAAPVPVPAAVIIRDIYRREGMRGYWRGYWMGLAVFVPHTMIYFVAYEELKRRMGLAAQANPTSAAPAAPAAPAASEPIDASHSATAAKAAPTVAASDLPWTVYASASGGAACIASGLSNVMDIIKTRVQCAAAPTTGLIEMRRLWRDAGVAGFLRGAVPRILWAVPTTVISMTLYEGLKDAY
ncbi:hypothetical protein CXG81DRAFT_2220, partial [Caulochytrium protostelioides]